MYIFTGPSPDRDGDLDAEVVLHEYTHALSDRRVGGGVGISALQTGGMGEGWSDFYAMTLLSEPGDDVNGVYANGGYVTYLLGGMTQNYYFGIRRYPYCTDMTKNPLTFKDIDPAQASSHPGVPRSPIIGNAANEVHNMGEVWCVTLWEARANLIAKYGSATGNQLVLELVTDGMNLSPANPNFLQARDAILQADQVDTGGANRRELWAAIAKRGMGTSATSPSSSTTSGLVEAFDVPDDLFISPALLSASGPVGGPFSPSPASFILTNTGSNPFNWSLANTSSWVSVDPSSGTLIPGGPATLVNVTVGPAANGFPLGAYTAGICFTNQTSGVAQLHPFVLYVVGRNLFDDFDPGINLSLWSSFGGVVNSTVLATNYGGCISPPNSLWFGDGGSRFATTVPINTSSGGAITFYLRLAQGDAWPWETVDLPGEGVVLEYSLDSGATWATAGTYNTATYYNWTQVALPIPAGAQGPAVMFRWRQLSNSGSASDHWALDSVAIDAGPLPPTIYSQPQSQTAVVGDDVVLSITAWGSQPMSYQWQFNGTNLDGTTTSSLGLTNVQFTDAGSYSVFLSNSLGTLLSSNAVLTVNPPPPCAPPPAGLVSWWRAAGDASDTVGSHNGILSGGVSFQRGKVGQAFSLNGVDGAVDLGTWFNFQTFSVALWVKAGATQVTSADMIDNNHTDYRSWVVQYNTGLQFFWYSGNYGKIFFNLTPNTWQYLVITLDTNHMARVYVDGQLQGSIAGTQPLTYDGTEFLRLGRWGSGGRYFNGMLDEADVYDRALSPAEITALYAAGQSGKCLAPAPPVILSQPADLAVAVGGTAAFSVTASGTPPLSYQWSFNGSPLPNATRTSLVLTSVTTNQAGAYAVLVTNQYGSALSSNAILTVSTNSCLPPPAGLISWWPGEGDATDAVGAHNGILTGGVSFPPGKVGQAFSLNGVDAAVDLGTWFNLQTFSVALWVKASATQGISADLIDNNHNNYRSWVVQYNNTGLQFFWYSSNFGQILFNLTPNTWQHLVITLDTNYVARVYLDGHLQGSIGGTQPIAYDGTQFLRLGRWGSGGRYFNGMLDEVDVYNRALSPEEITALYSAGQSGKCPLPPAPVILSQPADQTVAAGSTATFIVTASGTPPLSYQWSFNGTNLTGATTNPLTLANVQFDQGGRYAVLVTNLYGAALSSNASLTVTAVPPAIVSAPVSQIVLAGANVSFTVVASGTPPLSYQWRFNGADLIGQTSNSLALLNVQTNDAGDYSVLVTNLGGSALSPSAHLTVLPVQTNCIPPPSGLVGWWPAEGDASDDAGGHKGTLSGGVSFQPGKVGQAFSLNGVDGAVDLGPWFNLQTFSVALWVKAGATQVTSADIIDNNHTDYRSWVVQYNTGLQFYWYSGNFGHIFFSLTPNTWQYLVITLDTNYMARVYLDGQLQGSIAGTQPITYDGTQFLRLGRWGSGGRYFNGMLDEVDVYNRALSAAEIQALYAIGSGGKCLLPPAILSQPQDRQVFQGNSVALAVVAAGSPPLNYQWSFNTTNIPGATNAFLILNDVQFDQAGTYTVLVSSPLGSVLSSNAILTVNPPPPCVAPPSGLVGWWRAEANTIDAAGTNDGTLAGNTTYAPGQVGLGFVLDGTGDGVRVGNPASLRLQNFTIEAWIRRASTTLVTGSAGNNGMIFSYGTGGYGFGLYTTGQPMLSQIDNNLVAASAAVTDTNFHHVAVTKTATTVIFYIDGVAYPASAYGNTFSFSTTAAVGARGDNFGNSFLGTLDEVSVYNRALSAAEIQSIYSAFAKGKCPLPPAILTQPQPQQVGEGGTATFTVAAAGTRPFGYQWRYNTTNITGATNAALVLSNVQTNQAGNYTVLVANPSGTALSANAALTVATRPRIKQQPARQLVRPECSAVFTVAARGTPPLRYQWWKGAVALPGQTNNSLTVPNVQTNDFGSTYFVVVSNAYGYATSSTALLSLDTVPVAVSDVIERFAVGGLRVKGADLVANDTDADGDSLEVAEVGATSVAGGTVTWDGGWVYYTPPPGFTNSDVFAYTVSDGHCGGRAVGLVTVQVKTDDTPVCNLSIQNPGDGSVRLAVDGKPGETYRLQDTEAAPFTNWLDLVTQTADVYGVCEYIHWGPTNAPARFYRAVTP